MDEKINKILKSLPSLQPRGAKPLQISVQGKFTSLQSLCYPEGMGGKMILSSLSPLQPSPFKLMQIPLQRKVISQSLEDKDGKMNKVLDSLPPLQPCGMEPKQISVQRKVVLTKKIPRSVIMDIDHHLSIIHPKNNQNNNVNFSDDSSHVLQTEAPPPSVLDVDNEDTSNSPIGDGNDPPQQPTLQLHQNKFHCSYCRTPFDKLTLLTQHVQGHLILNKYSPNYIGPDKCSICGKELTSNEDLVTHLCVHNKEKSQQEQLILNKSSTNYIGPAKCNICGKEISSNEDLVTHVCVYNNKKSHQCQHCNKSCVSNAHICTHANKKPFECQYCQKCFSTKSCLQIHIRRRHMKEKPYTFCISEKSFSNKCDLVDHSHTHKKEKPYKCEVCEKGFSQMSNLKTHKRKIHAEGEKPHKCDHCEKSFLFLSQLSIHMKRHKGQQHKCGHCKKYFLNEADLKRHSETKHPIKDVVLCS